MPYVSVGGGNILFVHCWLVKFDRRVKKGLSKKETMQAGSGAKNIDEHLPRVIRAVRVTGSQVLWVCDPMHGNTESTAEGIKTRRFDNIFSELESAEQWTPYTIPALCPSSWYPCFAYLCSK